MSCNLKLRRMGQGALFFFLFFLSIVALAQPTSTYVKDVIMPAPSAASLGKYGDIPVNYFTGLPSIDIPIYTIQEGPLSLPISLSYHASGIKVGEPASWVGAGWSLNAGGMITRTVLGLRDEVGAGYYNNGNQVEENNSTIYEIANGELDGEADIFSFNISGYSGKFIIDKDHHCHLIPKQDLKIEFEYNSGALNFQWFTVTTPDGTRYHFGNVPGGTTDEGIEQTAVHDGNGGGGGAIDEYYSTWYLVQIESADKKWHIDLEYDNEIYSIASLASCYDLTIFCETTGGQSSSGSIGCYGQHDSELDKYVNKTSILGKRLRKSTTSTSTQVVDFISNIIREDLGNAFYMGTSNTSGQLNEIHVSSGDFCSKWVFSYDYFKDPANQTRSEYKRLKLDQIQQKDCNGDPTLDIPPYVFYYEGTLNGDGSAFFPNRLSKAIDHYGFYNGASANEDHQVNIPPTTVNVTFGGTTTHITKGNSDRETDESKSKYGILKQIKYPTGGSTYFTLESNTHFQETTQTDNLLYLTNCGYPPVPTCCDNTTITDTKTLTNNQIDYGQFKLRLDAIDPNGGNTGNCYQDPYSDVFA
ncbi:MAG: type IV secretion protein Rhs, partial [Saprospiraceae bacterium]